MGDLGRRKCTCIVESESCPITFAMSLWTVDCPPARLPSWERFKKSPRYLVKQEASKRPRMWKIVAFFKRRNRRPHPGAGVSLTFVLLLVFASCRHNRALRERIMVLSELEGGSPSHDDAGAGISSSRNRFGTKCIAIHQRTS